MRTVLLFFPLLLLACSAPENPAGKEADDARDTTVFNPGPDTAAAPTILVFGRIKDAETGEGM